jgi:Xaa-Pro aminopeptidase
LNTPDRLQKLRRKLAEQKLEAILIASSHNRYYLSGFSGSAGYLLITADKAILATDFRYVEQAGREAPDYTVSRITGELAEWFPRLIAALSLSRLAFESEHVTFALYQQLQDALNKSQLKLQLQPVTGLVESLRVIKEPEEIKLITRAVEITDAAFSYINGKMKLGMSELQVAWEIEKFMREHTSQSLPFDIIVASGPNAALPHAKPTSRPIGTDEPVVIDIGARFGGYTSDLTRTLCLGEDDIFHKLYDVVRRAQLAAITGIRENMTGNEADSLARSVIEQEGYGAAFGHGLGHGIGLETHEQPRAGLKSPDTLSNGMVFTVEPGIYISGWGGIRIEDDVVMENGTARVISQTAR